MSRTAKATGNFKSVSPGTYVARCYRIIDIGTQHSEWNGEEKVRNQIVVFWELPGETAEFDGVIKPLSVSKFYTNSLHEKANLRADLKAWRGRDFDETELAGFDLNNIVGKPCLVTVSAKENGKTEVASVSPLMKGQECPVQVNTSQTFWLDEYSDESFNALSDGMKKLVAKSEEYQAIKSGAPFVYADKAESTAPDDMPF